jgi:hypothetical protein
MADCVAFRIYVGDTIAAVMTVLIDEMRRRGLSVAGSAESGSFTISLPVGGSISGTYAVTGKSITVAVSQRPESISCGTIESKLQDIVLDAKAVLKNRRRA